MRLQGLLAYYSLLVLGVSICTEEEASVLFSEAALVLFTAGRQRVAPSEVYTCTLLSACSALVLCIMSVIMYCTLFLVQASSCKYALCL